jgi:hypothetical protein
MAGGMADDDNTSSRKRELTVLLLDISDAKSGAHVMSIQLATRTSFGSRR